MSDDSLAPDERPPPAIMEPLDPEARPQHGSWGRRELILGLVLTLGVAVFGGWQWWTAQSRLTAYQTGTAAASQQDWDTAQAAFTTAAGYADGAQQAAHAGTLIQQREAAYARATSAAAHADWAGVLQAVQQLQPIAAHYRDTALLAAQATARLPAAALSGTVALRLTAQPPGLYHYTADGWHWLPGSDGQSQLVAACPNGDLVYDGPAAGAPPVTPRPQPLPSLAGSRVWLRSTPDGARQYPLSFGRDQYPQVRCTPHGVWGLRYASPTEFPSLILKPFPATVLVPVFQATGSRTVVTPTLPSPDWAPQWITPDGAHLLVVDTTGVTTTEWTTRLYLAAPDGSQREPLPPQPGALRWFDFTPDGRYLFVGLDTPATADALITTTAMVLDTTGVQAPRVLVRVAGQLPIGAGPPSLLWTVVERGPRAGQILLSWPAGTQQRLRLVDPAQGDPLVETTIDHPFSGLVVVGSAAMAGGLLINAWQLPVGQGLDGIPSYEHSALLYIAATQQVTMIPETGPPTYNVESARIVNDRLVVAGREATSSVEGRPYLIRSRPWPPAGAAEPVTTLVASATQGSPTEQYRGEGWRWGTGVITYLAPDGGMRARTVDGRVDLALPGQGMAGFLTGSTLDGP